MRIWADSRQQAGKHTVKHTWLEEHGIQLECRALPFGDYALADREITLSIDTKRSVSEVAQNISRDHERFKREMLRARDAGARLVILVENEHGYLTVDDVAGWVNDECRRCPIGRMCDVNGPGPCRNPRHKKSRRKPIQGKRLALAMKTMAERYGAEFAFCAPEDSARIIASMLREEEMRLERS